MMAVPDPQAADRFRRLPEVLLAAVALLGLWFVPVDFLSNLSPETTLEVVVAIPCVLVLFVFGGAALWRAFREI